MNKYLLTIFFALGFLLLFLFRGRRHGEGSGISTCIRVVATTEIVADAVRSVGGDRLCVEALMGPGVDPHLYHARESDVQRLAAADIIFYNGLHLEGKMGTLFERMSAQKPTYGVADIIDIQRLKSSGFEGLYDPHVWFDVQLWMQVVEGIRDQLKAYDPEHAHEYDAHAQVYLGELKDLDAYVHRRSSEVPRERRVLITAHDAFNYFGSAYGFDVVGLQGISTDSEVGTADVVRLVDIIVGRNVPALFTEASIPARNIEAVQRAASARGHTVVLGPELYSDTLGEPGTIAATYKGMVRSNIDTIVAALS